MWLLCPTDSSLGRSLKQQGGVRSGGRDAVLERFEAAARVARGEACEFEVAHGRGLAHDAAADHALHDEVCHVTHVLGLHARGVVLEQLYQWGRFKTAVPYDHYLGGKFSNDLGTV